MKNVTLLKIASLFIFLLSAQSSFGQEQLLYSENFTGQLNVGIDGPAGNAIDPSAAGVTWTMDVTDCTFSAHYEHFKVINVGGGSNNERLQANDTDGEAIWYSPSINISSYNSVRFNFNAYAEGSNTVNHESSDYIKTYYSIDGGSSWTQVETNGDINDDFGALTTSQTGLSGSTLQIKVVMENNDWAGEQLSMDNLEVYGTSNPTAAFSASANAVDTTQTITFTNNSTNATSYSWNFGDSTTSSATSPIHQYASPGSYTVTLTATGSSGSDTATTSITVYTAGTCSAVGTILMERYDGITGTAISDLTGSANYPQSPTSTTQRSSFEIPADVANDYGAKVSGYICAPQTGYYTFWIASDDNGQLNLSTDDDPANKTTISWVDSWTSSREWDKFTTQKSDPILLVMGESYYVEALMKEANGGDNLAVGWAKPGQPTNAPSQIIPGSVLSPMVYCPSASFTASGTSVETGEGITFTNTTTGSSPTYSWDFGDGTTSTAASPTHQYAWAGTYTVTLTATNSCGSDTATTSITVTYQIEDLFYENFEDESDNDITGTDANGIPWTATLNGHSASYFGVDTQSGNKLFRVDDLSDSRSGIKWESNPINIAGYESLELSSSLWFYETDPDDYLRVKIEVDGVTTTVASFEDDVNDQDGDKTWTLLDGSGNPITGASLKIIIEFYHDSDEDYWVDNIKLTGELTLPGCASYISPNDGATDVSLTPTVSWDAVSGATGYKVFYGTDSNTSTAVAETASTSVILPTLQNGTQYYWKVVPTNARGDANGCIAISFTTIPLAPGCASYTSPTDGDADVSLTPELSWSAVSGATGYKVYYGTDSGTSIYFGETANTSVILPQLGYEAQYFWKVVPTNAGGEATGCSVISFTTLKNPAGSVFITGNTVTISKNAYLYLEKDFTNTGGSLTLNSSSTEFASIIVEGTASGNITYNRFVNYQAAGEWDIIGPPVLNQNMQSFAQTNTNNNTTSGAMAMGGDYYALGQYYTGWGSWVNYTTSTIPDANFPAAKGYQMGTNSIGSGNDIQGQTLAFTGEIATTTQTINIQNQNGANGGNGRRWNLVANPFSSYINGNTNAGTTNGGTNFIDVNANVLDLEYTGLYYWDADEDGWDVFNQLQTNSNNGTLFIAPGQGFFVAARNSEVAQISFTPQMRTILGGDDFISGAPILLNYKLDLKLFNGSAERAKTKFHFQQGLTLGLDTGYDAGAYNQATALSSRLPEDDQEVNFQLNAMNLEAAYNQSIPLVINQEVGQNFRVSISNNTLPEDVNVYLEDTQNGTLTSLKDQDFELIAQSDLSDAGRFYIRFTTQNLAVNDVLSPSSLTVFKLNTDAFVTIQGLTPEMGKTTATLYNMLGMKVREKALNNTAATQQISTQGLASGVYIINLKAGDQAVSKKVIIQ